METLIGIYASEIITEPDIPYQLLVAIAFVESSFNAFAISACGAMGLFQFMPITVLDLAQRFDLYICPFDTRDATVGAKTYLAWLARQFREDYDNGDYTKILAAWNWGYGNVKKWLRGEEEMPRETQNFIERVMSYYEKT